MVSCVAKECIEGREGGRERDGSGKTQQHTTVHPTKHTSLPQPHTVDRARVRDEGSAMVGGWGERERERGGWEQCVVVVDRDGETLPCDGM